MTHEIDDDPSQDARDREYPRSEDLLRDLGGARGVEAREVARGYLMAIQDAEADCLSAATLLQYLRGDRGTAMELAGMGYVLAIREWMTTSSRPAESLASPAVPARMRRDAAHVKAWLERRPESVVQSAMAMVQVALSSDGALGRRRAGLSDFCAVVRRWFGTRPGFSNALAVVAVALAVVAAVGWHGTAVHDRLTRAAAAQDLEVTRYAANITTMMLEQRRFEKDSIINVSDRREIDAYARRWAEARASMSATIDRLGRMDLESPDRDALVEIRRDLGQYESGYLQLLAQMQTGQIRTSQDANRVFASYKPAAHRIERDGAEIASRALSRLQLR